MSDGVRHSYLFYRRRPTLAKALVPLRKLGNAIYAAPSPRYARLAIDAAVEIAERESADGIYSDVSLALILSVPVANQFPDETVDLLATLRDRVTKAGITDHFISWIDDSISNLEHK